MAFTWVDWAIIAIVAVSSLISLTRGFVKEALSLVTWIVAGVIAGCSVERFRSIWSATLPPPRCRSWPLVRFFFVATLLVGALVNFLIGELVRVTGLSGTDRVLGMVFGAARGGLLVILLVGLLSLAPVQQDAWWQNSVLLPHFLIVADWSKNLILGFSSQWFASGISVPR